MTKVNPQNWSQIDLLINNFYEIVEYKRGRGVYGDRVIWKRSRHSEAIFGEQDRLFEFYYMDANAVKELPRTISEKIKTITRFATNPQDMNILCEFGNKGSVEPAEWALETEREILNTSMTDFKQINDILIERYKKLDASFISKLNKHREKQYFLAASEGFKFITQEYADEQMKVL